MITEEEYNQQLCAKVCQYLKDNGEHQFDRFRLENSGGLSKIYKWDYKLKEPSYEELVLKQPLNDPEDVLAVPQISRPEDIKQGMFVVKEELFLKIDGVNFKIVMEKV